MTTPLNDLHREPMFGPFECGSFSRHVRPILSAGRPLPELAHELVRLDVDLLFVSGDQGVKAAKDATDTIPILVAACDPIQALVVSIARPAGKVTGATCISSELSGKRLQILKELVPALASVAGPLQPGRSKQVI